MPKPIPTTEAERTAEAEELLAKLTTEDTVKMTTWEIELVESLKAGIACTRIRLKEVRELCDRLYPPANA